MKPIGEIILENSNLIYSIASKFKGDIDDLFQAGCIGMIEAYRKFDEKRNVKFTTFAYPYILGRISEFARENHTIKISKDMARAKKKIEKAKDYLTQELLRNPTNEELSHYLNIPLETLEMLVNYKGDIPSLDDFYYEDLSLYDVISKEDIDYDTLIYLKSEIENLGEPERTIMYQRYFLDKTQSEIANNLGLSQVEISRRENKVLVKFRKTFNWHLLFN